MLPKMIWDVAKGNPVPKGSGDKDIYAPSEPGGLRQGYTWLVQWLSDGSKGHLWLFFSFLLLSMVVSVLGPASSLSQDGSSASCMTVCSLNSATCTWKST